MNQLNAEPTKPKRRWYQFSLKSLFLIMLFIGAGGGIAIREYVQIQRHNNDNLKLQVELLARDNEIYRLNRKKFGMWNISLDGNYVHLTGDNNVKDEDLAVISKLPSLKSVTLYSSKVSAEGLLKLKNAKELDSLFLYRIELSDEAIEKLKTDRPKLNVLLLGPHMFQDSN